MFLLTADYVIFYMSLLFTLWRMNKYQSINQSINQSIKSIIKIKKINLLHIFIKKYILF